MLIATFRLQYCDICDRCEHVMSVLDDIETALQSQKNLSVDDSEELRFIVCQFRTSILWKAHILRSIHQDAARFGILESLDDSSVLVIQDWAMKYLLRKYCESQTDWFGKRGIPWHISVAFRKMDGEVELMTFCHIFKHTNQESSAVGAVAQDVIQRVKHVMPYLSTVYYRQDNAGCYHSGPTMVFSSVIGKKAGVNLKHLDFSDPQGGKGACDRKAASIKSHTNVYLNAGHDIDTPEQMFEAMASD